MNRAKKNRFENQAVRKVQQLQLSSPMALTRYQAVHGSFSGPRIEYVTTTSHERGSLSGRVGTVSETRAATTTSHKTAPDPGAKRHKDARIVLSDLDGEEFHGASINGGRE